MPIHSDAPGFLFVLALLRGEWLGTTAPFRIEYPVYPYLMYLANRFVADWVLAAKWAAFVPSVLSSMLVFGATQVLSRDRYAAFFAGLLVASSPELVLIGTAPLYDSTFLCAFALFLLVGFLFVRKPTTSMALYLGIVMGLCWTSRALGLFLILPLLCTIFVLPGLPKIRKFRLALVVLGSLFVVGALVRLPARIAAKSLPPDQTQCVKDVMLDGIRYAGDNRDTVVYRLNDSATAFLFDEAGPCTLTWRQYVSIYYKDQSVAFAKNLKRIIFYDFVTIVSPFIVFFIPLCVGTRVLWQKADKSALILLSTTALSFLVFVSAIQYQNRYLFPLIILVAVVSGIGCAQLLQQGKAAKALLATLMVLTIGGGIDGCRQTLVKDESEANYRRASQWIIENDGKSFDFRVMTRHHGAYAYLKHGLILLPVDDPQRVKIFAEHSHVKYILAGPEERRHNPALFNGVPFLRMVGGFGTGLQSVQVFEVIRDSSDSHAQQLN
ncbi:MAG TPA: glycosyltransferase family 39 protein [Candidatus Acidoferrum sp.]|nr:glycosyltransferase family 39 protein [Candidatus Acidoferrum sp.]